VAAAFERDALWNRGAADPVESVAAGDEVALELLGAETVFFAV